MSVSIIIINYNTKDITLECINSIFKQTKDIKFDIWIIDNASVDDSFDAIKKAYPNINVIRNQRNLGFASANNIGILASKNDYVFLLNSDTKLLNNAVKIIYDYLSDNSDIYIAGAALYNFDNIQEKSFGKLPNLKNYIFNELNLKILNKPVWANPNKIQNCEYVNGAAMMIKRSLFDKIGLLSSKFFMYNEELEFQFRAYANGYYSTYIPDAKIFHMQGASIKDTILQQYYMFQGDYIYFALTCDKIPKILLRMLFSIILIKKYIILKNNKYFFDTLKIIWKI